MSKIARLRTVLISMPLALVGIFHAYLDPGSGSFLVQLIIGTIVGVVVFLKVYWNKIRSLFARSSSNEAKPSRQSGGHDSPPDAS